MTAEEVVQGAMAEAAEFASSYPTTRSVMFRRVTVRQQQLFALAATIDPDWAGVCADAPLAAGAANLASVMRGEEAGVPGAEHVSRVEVLNAGVSELPVGAEISVVPSDDVTVALPPRMTLRSWVFRSVGADLTGVASIRVYYSRRPFPVTRKTDVIELPEPWAELLVIDLARNLVQKATSVDKEVRAHAVTYFNEREAEALEGFKAHVGSFVSETVRFAAKA
jgi:hypothetical protein